MSRPNAMKTFFFGWGLVGVLALGSVEATEHVPSDPLVQEAGEGGGGFGDLGVVAEWFGVRSGLAERGVEIFGGYAAEVWGNTTGGEEAGAVYTGLLDFGVNVDLERALGWRGASVSTTWFWLSGRDASEDLVGNFLTISNIAGFNTLRLGELWFQQNLLEDRLSVRVGQLLADAEFIISDYAGLFLNGTFGWPAFVYMNLPGGGPGYPMGTLGARVAVEPWDWLTVRAAVFQGNVYDQNVNRHGFRWRLDGENGFLFLNEAQVRWNHRDGATGLPGQGKAGMWIQTGALADTLADHTTSGNYGGYFILDQMLHREAEVPDGKSAAASEPDDQGLGIFGRVAIAPQDRNFLNFYFDVGLSYKGLVPTRDDDTVGIAFAYAQLGNAQRNALAAEGSIGASAEMVLEFTYQAQITPWLSVQPDVQFVIQPGGTRDFGNALVIGGRVTISF